MLPRIILQNNIKSVVSMLPRIILQIARLSALILTSIIFCHIFYTVEPRYNEVLGTMKITLLYQVSHYIRVKKQRNIKSWDKQYHLVIRGFCYIRPLYNEVPLYKQMGSNFRL